MEMSLESLARPAIALLLAAWLGACGGETSSGGTSADGSQAQAPGSGAAEAGSSRTFNITGLGYDEGEEDAPIRVVEFSDFGCPHCQAFHLTSYPTVHEEFVETGQVLWKYVPYVLGAFPNSVVAARAGECAIEQDAFPALRDRIFAEQMSWLQSEAAADLFVGYAEEEGLDAERLASCMEEGRREEQLRQNIEIGRQIGIRGTPSFIVNGTYIQGNRPPEFFRRLFEQIEAQGSGSAPPPGAAPAIPPGDTPDAPEEEETP